MDRRTFLAVSTATALAGATSMTEAAPSTLPLLAPWTGPHNGAPPFDKVIVADFKPGLLAAMEENRAEIAAIAANPAPADFDNTIAAMENSGRTLDRVAAIFNVWTSTLNDASMRAVAQEMAPILAAFEDEVVQNADLFARVKAVYDGRETSNLSPEQKRLAVVTHRQFARRGAALTPQQKARMAAINQRLATLYTQFSQNELADEEGYALTLTGQADLAGLPPSLIAGAAEAAKAKGQSGSLADHQHPLVDGTVPDLFEPARPAGEGLPHVDSRGDNGGAHDNNAIITEILDAARREGQRCSASPPSPTGSPTTRWPRRRTPPWT